MGYENFGIPVLSAKGKSLAEAWENSMLELYNKGGEARTQYDKPTDRLSKDATMMVVVEDPLSEPFVHRAFPGGLDSLEEYRQEVIEGIKNSWCREASNPADERWEYTYNERLFAYAVPLSKITECIAGLSERGQRKLADNKVRILLKQPWAKVVDSRVIRYDIDKNGMPVVVGTEHEKTVVINQIEACVDGLIKTPYTRRVQAITWKPWEDLVVSDPACLQSLWFRILPDKEGKNPKLSMNVRFRSRDAYDAAFMNMFAFISLQEDVTKRVSEGRGEQIGVGRYADLSDSYHIYGSRLDHFEEGFLKLYKERAFEDRTWTREFVQPIFDEAKPIIAEKVRKKNEEYAAGKLRK